MSAEYTIPARDGMLAHLVSRIRPDLAERIAASGRIETAVIGLGNQGKRHAGLMKDYGTAVVAGVDPKEEMGKIHDTIRVYPTIRAMLERHPDIAAVSIWKHYTTAAASALDAIEAGIPIVVLISEGMPVRDVRKVLVAARRKGTLLIGPNTPGVIFPPEKVKVGMLPDVFYPAEFEENHFTADGVTICSRSGAILYHMSDAMATAGISQNAVIGVGGDSAIGSPFPVIVPLVSTFPKTDVVVVAGEIGGAAEERLAADIKAHPEKYPKPIVALISGRRAPEGKTMGHAGAIVAPGQAWGTWESKRAALTEAGVTVVNSQPDLVEAVRKVLGGKTYFRPSRYADKMRSMWEAAAPPPSWGTTVTKVEPNNLVVRGAPLVDIIGNRSLLEVSSLIVGEQLPSAIEVERLEKLALAAAAEPVPAIPLFPQDDVSKQLGALLLTDPGFKRNHGGQVETTVYALGRVAAYFATILGHDISGSPTFPLLACRAMAGEGANDPRKARILEAAMVASVDHGVTPPSAQSTILSSTVRPAFEVALAAGIMAITDVHGGAGAKAAEFFGACARRADAEGLTWQVAAEKEIKARLDKGQRVEGLGHRVHTRDPRRDVLWRLAEETGVAGTCVGISRIVGDAFKNVKGMNLPVNVDGVIGAIVADMGLDPRVGKALFIFGRVAGLAAHHYEELMTQPKMRRVNFEQAEYRGA